MVTKETFKKDLEWTKSIKERGNISEFGEGLLSGMEKYKNLILCNSSKEVVEEFTDRQQIKDCIKKLTELL